MSLSNWHKLLERALLGLDALDHQGIPIRGWSFGGGTALMTHFHHRDSRDIDLFVTDPQYLAYLSPRTADAAVWGVPDYDEATHYVKLRYAEGEIDFIVSHSLSNLPNGKFDFCGRSIPIESPTEIILKKLHYRAGLLKPRDIFDTAVVLSTEHATCLIDHGYLLANVRERLIKRLNDLPDEYFHAAMDELNIFPEWEHITASARDSVMDYVTDLPKPELS